MKTGDFVNTVNMKYGFAAMFILAVIIHGCSSRKQTAPPASVPEVGTITIEPKDAVLATELPGRTSSFLVAEIRPQISGILLKRCFTEGADVSAGDVLYEIDPAPFKAALENATANLDSTRNSVGRAKAALAVSQAGVARQKAMADLAELNRKRLEKLYEKKVAAIDERDSAITNDEVAKANLLAAEAQVETDKQGISTAEAAVRQAEAAVETAKINLGYTKITAPISGRIGRSSVTNGALVSAYQPIALATIHQLDPIYVDIPQSTAEVLRLKHRAKEGSIEQGGLVQKKVKLFLEDGTAYSHEGTLQFREVTVDPTTGSVILRAVFPNPEGLLLPSMFVRAIIIEGVKHQAILIPQQAVSRDPRGTPMAMVVDGEGKAAIRVLSLDRAVGNQWLINSGLAAGDRLIVDGLLKVRPGVPVKAIPANLEQQPASRPAESQPSTRPN